MYFWNKLKKRATSKSSWWLHTAELAVPDGRDFQCICPLGFSPLQVTLIKPRAARGWSRELGPSAGVGSVRYSFFLAGVRGRKGVEGVAPGQPADVTAQMTSPGAPCCHNALP